MKTIGKYKSHYRSDNDSVILNLEIENENVVKELEQDKDRDYFITLEPYQEKRSLQANRYLWKLCDLIAYKLHLTKEIVYLMKLTDYGLFVDISVRKDAYKDTLTALQAHFKYIQDMAVHGEYKDVRCYIGSSYYNKKEMQRLLSGVVQDARDLGIETWDDEEINMMLKAWEGGKK